MKKVASILLFALTACSHGTSSSASNGYPSHAAVGARAPRWSEKTSSGATFNSGTLLGKPVYMNFFATWCPPCNDEAPDIESLSKRYAARGLQVIGVDVMEDEGKAKLFGREHHLTYPLIVDDGRLRDAYSLNGLPVHVFIAANGIVRAIRIGELSKAQMEQSIRSILPR